MSKHDYKILYSNYSGVEKKAIELLSREVGAVVCRDAGAYTIHVLPTVPDTGDITDNCIIIGQYANTPSVQAYISAEEIPANGYLVKVLQDDAAQRHNVVLITAHSAIGVFYGAVDFVDNYLPDAEKILSNYVKSVYNTFDDALPAYVHASAPATETRSIFTWGQPIGNYREYIDNAARCKINQLIIWNDYLPLNAEDVVAYAHEYEMELIWGFAWGWSTNCLSADISRLDAMREAIARQFRDNYLAAGDGIYFQSFTETHEEYIDGMLIAEAVVRLVNETAAEIYKLRPDIHIQFGLHAISVAKHLEYFEEVDPRIEIVWEDCGAFPYHYLPKEPTDAEKEETRQFTEKIIRLRQNGRTGIVYKGLMTLDWSHFAHQSGPYILGMNAPAMCEADRTFLTPMWRNYTAQSTISHALSTRSALPVSI